MFYRFLIAAVFTLLSVPQGAFGVGSAVAEQYSFDGEPIVIAHRSAVMGGFPENTLAWIEYGIWRGVDALHINLQRTADDRYVLMHDNTLNRTTDVQDVYPDGPPGGPTRVQRGGRDYVADYTYEEITRLTVEIGDNGKSHRVPTMEEAIDLVDGRALVVLGLKSYELESLAKALEGNSKQNLLLFDLYYSGTDQSKLRDLSAVSGIGVAVSLFRSRDYHKDLNGISDQLGEALKMVSVSSKYLTPDFVTRSEELELGIILSGWNGPEDAALVNDTDPEPWLSALRAGFAAFSDQPDMVLKILDR